MAARGSVKVKTKTSADYKKILDNIKKLKKNPYAKVGVLGKSGIEKGTDLTVAQVATFQEYGTTKNGNQHIPPRSFLRGTLEEKREEIFKLATTLHSKILEGFDVESAIKILGSSFSAMVKARISEGIDPENAPSTIARKGSSKPLIDTGQLRQSISYETVMEGGGAMSGGVVSEGGDK